MGCGPCCCCPRDKKEDGKKYEAYKGADIDTMGIEITFNDSKKLS